MTLKQQLISRFKRRGDQWVSSGAIQRWCATETKYTASNATRRLRELQNEGEIEVKYVKGHAWYKLAEKTHHGANRGQLEGVCGCMLCQLFAKETEYVT